MRNMLLGVIYVLLVDKLNNLNLFQGALDGGLDIPHSDKRFAGFDKDKKELDADVHRKYVFGGHVASYMKVWHILFSIVLV